MTISPISPRPSHFAGAATLALLLSLSGPALAQVDLQKSTVDARFKQMNMPFDGQFKRFDAQIAFDPVKPSNSSAKITVDTGSYDLGNPSLNKAVRGKDGFDAAHYAHATFVSSSVVPAGDGEYSVTGRLTIRGKTQDVVVPVSMTEQGGTRVFDGRLPVRRRGFGIGQGKWADTAVLADEAVIEFHLVVAK
ncbi:YceI family protein [Pararobbsia alpina]|uniref:Protein YceI n=1 Tax=Pararobbsia alpina TaxID=621374 RepID=A0A6S7CCQ2_9BURK|nr:YceI family protein [Pararobbsia alpina]CAB3777117.1 Protein YceI [Pararobbsia alpina]